MDLMKLRFILAIVALVATSVAVPLIVFFGKGLDSVQVGLLTLFGGALIAECKTSAAYVFDGVPDKPDTVVTTVSTTDPKDAP